MLLCTHQVSVVLGNKYFRKEGAEDLGGMKEIMNALIGRDERIQATSEGEG